MQTIDELLILSIMCAEGKESEKIRSLYREKIQEWIKDQNEWLRNYLLLDEVYYEKNYKSLENDLMDSAKFLYAYEKWLFLKKNIEIKSNEDAVQLEKWFIPDELCVVKKEMVEPYQRFFDEIYACFLYMVWGLGDQENPIICRYTGHNVREQVRFLNEIILPYGREWSAKKRVSYWYICRYSENDCVSYEYCSYELDCFSTYHLDSPYTEKIGEYLWRVNKDEGLRVGNGGYVKFFGVGRIHNLSVEFFRNKGKAEDILTEIPTAAIDTVSVNDGITALEKCVTNTSKKHYCVSPKDFTSLLNLMEMNRMADIRKTSRLCPFCGSVIQNSKSICEKHGCLSLL